MEVGVSDGTPMMMIFLQAKFYQQIFIILFLLTLGQIQIKLFKILIKGNFFPSRYLEMTAGPENIIINIIFMKINKYKIKFQIFFRKNILYNENIFSSRSCAGTSCIQTVHRNFINQSIEKIFFQEEIYD